MARTVPVYAFQAADGSTIRFAADSDFWITNLTGEDGVDVEMTEQQSTGQTGKTITGQSIGSRSLTVTGSILRDLDANEALLKRLVRPKETGLFLKTVGDTTWYLEVLPSHTPDVSGGEHLLNFQFKTVLFVSHSGIFLDKLVQIVLRGNFAFKPRLFFGKLFG